MSENYRTPDFIELIAEFERQKKQLPVPTEEALRSLFYWLNDPRQSQEQSDADSSDGR